MVTLSTGSPQTVQVKPTSDRPGSVQVASVMTFSTVSAPLVCPAAGSSVFNDVADGQYYAMAVTWAGANGVVSGYGNGRFGPNDPITREQMAVILRGYARLNGMDVSAQADLSGYTDADKISPYAREAISWANACGLINGTSAVTLTPAGTATRAQAAVILRGFCENVMSDS